MSTQSPTLRNKLKTISENGLLSVVVDTRVLNKTHRDIVGSISLVASQATREMFLKDMVTLALSTIENLDIADNLLPFRPKTGSGIMA